jgi:hypothetical protein
VCFSTHSAALPASSVLCCAVCAVLLPRPLPIRVLQRTRLARRQHKAAFLDASTTLHLPNHIFVSTNNSLRKPLGLLILDWRLQHVVHLVRSFNHSSPTSTTVTQPRVKNHPLTRQFQESGTKNCVVGRKTLSRRKRHEKRAHRLLPTSGNKRVHWFQISISNLDRVVISRPPQILLSSYKVEAPELY